LSYGVVLGVGPLLVHEDTARPATRHDAIAYTLESRTDMQNAVPCQERSQAAPMEKAHSGLGCVSVDIVHVM
jgi:hypothetical protein